jgi:Flp pilus assembly protein TadG
MGFLFPLPLRRRLRAFAADEAGVSAVEFALLLPVMLLLYAGCAELTTALAIDRKTTRAASTLTDLLAQDAQSLLTGTASAYNSAVTSIMAASKAVLEPYSTTNAKLILAVINIQSATKQTVSQCNQSNDSCPTIGSSLATSSPYWVPSAIASSGQVVVGRVQYTYVSPFSGLLAGITGSGTYKLDHKLFMKPRSS